MRKILLRDLSVRSRRLCVRPVFNAESAEIYASEGPALLLITRSFVYCLTEISTPTEETKFFSTKGKSGIFLLYNFFV